MFEDKSCIKVFIISLIILVVIFLWSLGTGRYDLNIISVSKILISKILNNPSNCSIKSESILFVLRLPRALGAVLVGSALSLSGGSYQGVFKNPLVSPNLLGVSAGASVGAGISILLGYDILGVQIFSFFGGILAVLLTSNIPKLLKNNSDIMLVLTGIIVGGVMGSIMGIIKYVADSETQLPAIIYWQMGTLSRISYYDLIVLGPIMIISMFLLILVSWRINVLSLGDKEAKTLGINVERLRGLIIVLSTILTASCVCLAGTIGWIGLVIPHFARLIIGPDNSKMMPISAICGAGFMILVDTISRGISTSEIPISIITGLIGSPMYLYLLVKQGTEIK